MTPTPQQQVKQRYPRAYSGHYKQASGMNFTIWSRPGVERVAIGRGITADAAWLDAVGNLAALTGEAGK